jgi:glycosyltransferase involved in cell wall biosynthesis
LIKNGADPERVHTIGLGVDMKQFEGADGSAIRAKYGICDAPVVGFIGRQARYKGPDTLIKAMTSVWDRYPDAHLIIAGARTSFSVELDALIAAMPSDRRARVTVENNFADEDKPHWFAACDIVVSVSSEESFGLVFVEAWATGRPVIGGRIGAVECVIRDGEDGLLVPCGDPAKLATAIESLLADRPLRERMGRAGRAKVVSDHTWPIVVDRVRQLYERVANDWKGAS